jgi:ribonuclease E
MTKRLLIDASHAEETRVVVVDGNRIEDFDVETAARKQIKGNIYLAKVVRVEPSLQAAFVEYGGNRHGFLAFSEIHPDYYQIPVADRQKLLAMQAAAARDDEDADDEPPATPSLSDQPAAENLPPLVADPAVGDADSGADSGAASGADGGESLAEAAAISAREQAESDQAGGDQAGGDGAESEPPETFGGSEGETSDEGREPRLLPRFLRQYKIQEVIHRRQIMLVQVVKEERGSKGAALTTYISLPGRFCVLMPNSPRGGGVSRKITSLADRRRLKEVIAELGIPDGMSMIVRTAGANRPKPEIKRDCEYLLRLWDDIRETTLASIAPALIYEDASLIKRAIRDVYSRDIDEVIVDGEAGWRNAHELMRLLMPSHARKVIAWNDGGTPLFAHHQIESQLEAVLSPTVQLRSGGYLVINQTEALVAIDVNSGRSTRERDIEDTALRTNLEAAEEAARQLRLRDLAGLIVIDFIDMEQRRHNLQVERRLKEALHQDRARIQVGAISHFGLLEMSRQRLRPSLTETSLVTCPHCGGLGHVRSTESAAIHVLRAVEEEGAKRRAAEIAVHAAAPVVLYVLNNKRTLLSEIEARFGMRVAFQIDPSLTGQQIRIERLRAQTHAEAEPAASRPPASGPTARAPAEISAAAEAPAVVKPAAEQPAAEDSAEGRLAEGEERKRRRRRRRRGGSKRREEAASLNDAAAPASAAEEDEDAAEALAFAAPEVSAPEASAPEAPAPEVSAREAAPEVVSEPVAAPIPGPVAAETLPPLAPEPVPEPEPEAVSPGEEAPKRRARAPRRTPTARRRKTVAEGETLPDLALPGAPQPDLPVLTAPPAAPAPMAVTAPEVTTPEITTPDPDPAAAPMVQPTIVADAPPEAPRKRGWWRR